ncbi:anti-sigma factor [Aquimarina gracilis]|uniref:Anti-sigma factor n=1 Tax=Aquimarina gracilis TaxID=874422 RepID=A0ABU5ZWN6_9FLAO|nr:anti-sigma factor [Aquimarina gracilis]MEB3346286.1 anti-sigma factor [Aquimarina gracilis]
MMDRNTIKDNGILEQYLLGELSKDQRIEIENILKEDQQLREYFNKIEDDFEKLAFENAITPPTHVKKSILNSINENSLSSKDTHVIAINKNNNRSLYLSIAASLAVLFMLSSGWLYNQWQDSKNNLQIIQDETLDLRNRLVLLEENLKETNAWYTAINNPNTIQLMLKGNEISPTSTAITYVNHKDKTVILNPKGLAKLDKDKTYQMWADVDGVMIDMGVIPSDEEMIAMKYIENAESINITIEPEGGNDHPTVERLISNVLL